MDIERETDKILGRMTLEDKVGQCLTLNYLGWQIADFHRRFVNEFRCGGLRATPHISATNDSDHIRKLAPHVTPGETAAKLRELQEMALERNGIPLHLVTDQEGDLSVDMLRGGVQLFPSSMGMAATNDPALARRAFDAVARQMRAFGINMLHSPSLDVNLDPRNPEIGMRAFSDDPERCAVYGAEAMRAFLAAGIVPVAKHFPGRGDSALDAHDTLDTLRADRQRLDEVELRPYRELIRQGLPAIMTAHNAYPALDDEGVPASVSRKITTGLLREEMGFDGVITTDAIGMSGVMKYAGGQWGATVMAIQAGADLVLIREDEAVTLKCRDALLNAVRTGVVTEARIEESVRRILRMKMAVGLFEQPLPDPALAAGTLADPENEKVCRETFERCALVLRDRDGLLPLDPSARVLAVEPYIPLYHDKGNDAHCHPGMFYERMRERFPHAIRLETRSPATPEDQARFREKAACADAIVFFNVFWRGSGSNRPLIREAVRSGKPVVMTTNDLYDPYFLPSVGTAVCVFGAVPHGARVAADIVAGAVRPGGTWPLVRLSPDDTVSEEQKADHAVGGLFKNKFVEEEH